MTQVTINLYSFSDLNEEAKNKAIAEQLEFLNTTDEYGDKYDEAEAIDIIEANEYIFFADGTLASCTTYTGKHHKAGITEFKLGGEVYQLS